MSDRFSRNSTIIPAQKLDRLGIYGLGGVGSVLVLEASIMGFPCIVGMDGDTYKLHNASTSTYPMVLTGLSKAACASEISDQYSDTEAQSATFTNVMWEPHMPIERAVLCAIDSMEVRKQMYEKWLELSDRLFFIDVRVGAFSHEVITVTKNYDTYMDKWQPDEDIEDELCTARHTIFTSFASSATVMSQVQKLLAGIPYYAYLWHGLDINKTEKEGFVIDEDIFREEQGAETSAVRGPTSCQGVGS